MNDLNSQQLILLALFVSFVTSIATGIFTVSLLEQAPPVVTQTINRVVERTVETVVEGKTEVVNTVSEVTTDERVGAALARVRPGLVRVGSSLATSSAILSGALFEDEYLGVVADDGVVVTDSSIVKEGHEYSIGGLHVLR